MLFLLSGAILVTVSMPCRVSRWPTLAFGVLGAGNTCLFRDSASTSASSMRLFFERFLRALKQALSDTQAGIPIGMIAHLARFAQDQRGTWSIARGRLASSVAHDQTIAAMTLTAGIARIHTTGDDLLLPCLIFGIAEDAALHPVRTFRVATARILPLFGFEIAQVLKHHDARFIFFGELDYASAHQMGKGLITVADLAPEVGIVLLVLSQDAVLLRLTAMRPSVRFLKPTISLPPPMKRVARMVPSTVWTVQTARCSPRLRSTAQIFVSG